MFEQIKLPYEVNELEPVIDQTTIETHYGKHHVAYTKTFNELVEKAGLTGKSAEEILGNLDSVEDASLRTGLRNQGGGYYNHNLYFEILAPEAKAKHVPTGKLADKINETFGSFDALVEKLSALAMGQFGSGWAWLCTDDAGNLSVMNTPNQDNPFSLKCGCRPIFTLDVWEHAYYLGYKNLRAEYVKNFFRIVDWAVVEKKYEG